MTCPHCNKEFVPNVILSPRETEVFDLIRTGLSNREVAIRLGISVSNVKTCMGNIYRKKGMLDGRCSKRVSLVINHASTLV